MAAKIRVLDEHTINKIAAGEVIEGPSSVVKELVDNALDAGATEITIEIREGGRNLIRIRDNGSGMSQDDAILSLERHATSKIKEVEDIESILTRGFRGEAIPSIASISKFTILTKTQDDKEGSIVIVEGGKILKCAPASVDTGTTIEVKTLFFNVPVRRKFQKSPTYDANEILKVINLQSLANPHIKFCLMDQQKILFETHPEETKNWLDQLKVNAKAILGEEFIKLSSQVEKEHKGYKLEGFLGHPTAVRSNRSGQYLFINKRAVISPLISFLIKEAYGTTLAPGKHPSFLIHLTVPGDSVDVNVHPQKKEVRLRQESILREMILESVGKAFQLHEIVHEPVISLIDEPSEVKVNYSSFQVVKPQFSLQSRIDKDLQEEYESLRFQAKEDLKQQNFLEQTVKIVNKPSFPKVLSTIPGYIIVDAISLSSWKMIPKDGLCLIDKQAAQMRVFFEKLKKNENGIGIQSLLIPYSIELASHEAGILKDYLPVLHDKGLQIHEIGPNNFLINTIPEVLGTIDIAAFVKDLFDKITLLPTDSLIENEIEKQFAIAAVVATGNKMENLNVVEAEFLVQQLFSCQTPYFCPLGKATISYISVEELAKNFQKGSL